MIFKGRSSICHKLVYEVRYNYGFTYLDRCGITVNKVMKNDPEWILSDASPNPQNAPLISLKNGTRFNFSSLKYDFALDQQVGANKDLKGDISDFIEQTSFISTIVHEMLDLTDFKRVGFRIWYLFSSNSKEDSEKWISELLGTVPIDSSIEQALNGNIEARNYVALIALQDRKFRISINGVESYANIDIGANILKINPRDLHKDQDKFLQEQLRVKRRMAFNPTFATMVDIDSYVEMPKDVDARDFITESLKLIREKLQIQ